LKQAIHSFINILQNFKATNYYNYISRKKIIWTWKDRVTSC